MTGRIVTFYSWKGGVGRTMALANVGVQLARRGKRVLLADWDLEAPGLDRYFVATDKETASRIAVRLPEDDSGLLGMLSDAAQGQLLQSECWERRSIRVDLPPLPRSASADPPPSPASLAVLGAGLGSKGYASRLDAFSWAAFFDERAGGEWLERLRQQWRESYDFVLIDSRTGLTDGGGVCTVQMPDALVFVFTANTQSLEDGMAFLDGVQRSRALFAFERPPLTIVPLLARWEGDREVDLADSWLDRIAPLIKPLVETWLPAGIPERRLVERLRVPHVARFSFGEPLPVVTHSLSDPDRPGLAFDALSEILAGSFANAGQVIEPNYRPPLDPMHAADAELEQLATDDRGREAAIHTVTATYGARSTQHYMLLARVSRAAFQLGRLTVADDLAGRAVAVLRSAPENHLRLNNQALVQALLLQADIRIGRGALAEAMLGVQEALLICRAETKANPGNTGWRRNLVDSAGKVGGLLQLQGNLSGALTAYTEAVETARRLLDADSSNIRYRRDLSASLEGLGNVLAAQGDFAKALATYRESLKLDRQMADADPADASLQHDLSAGYGNIGDILLKEKDLVGSLSAYRQACAVLERSVQSDPSNPNWQWELSVFRSKAADVLRLLGRPNEALDAYRETLALGRRLAASEPSNWSWQQGLIASQQRIGDVLRERGDLPGALSAYRETLETAQRLTAVDPSNSAWLRDLSVSHSKVADVLRETGDSDGALDAYRQSLAVSRRLVEADPSNVVWSEDLARNCVRIAQIHFESGATADARRYIEEAEAILRKSGGPDPTGAGSQAALSEEWSRLDRLLQPADPGPAGLRPRSENLPELEK